METDDGPACSSCLDRDPSCLACDGPGSGRTWDGQRAAARKAFFVVVGLWALALAVLLAL